VSSVPQKRPTLVRSKSARRLVEAHARMLRRPRPARSSSVRSLRTPRHSIALYRAVGGARMSATAKRHGADPVPDRPLATASSREYRPVPQPASRDGPVIAVPRGSKYDSISSRTVCGDAGWSTGSARIRVVKSSISWPGHSTTVIEVTSTGCIDRGLDATSCQGIQDAS
jgi:hypothetical protein